jgi:hypothetical protein
MFDIQLIMKYWTSKDEKGSMAITLVAVFHHPFEFTLQKLLLSETL